MGAAGKPLPFCIMSEVRHYTATVAAVGDNASVMLADETAAAHTGRSRCGCYRLRTYGKLRVPL